MPADVDFEAALSSESVADPKIDASRRELDQIVAIWRKFGLKKKN